MSNYSKFLAALAGTVLIIGDAIADGVFTSQETETIALSFVTALFVFFAPRNQPTVPAPEA